MSVLTRVIIEEELLYGLRNLSITIGLKFKNFKILMLTFKALHGMASLYLPNILETYKPARSLRSSSKRLLIVPKHHIKTYRLRVFSFIAPRLWNDLPDEIKTIDSMNTFKTKLKTCLFRHGYQV